MTAAKRARPDILKDPVDVAEQMVSNQMAAVERYLSPGPKRNPLRDALPEGLTLKRLAELLRDA